MELLQYIEHESFCLSDNDRQKKLLLDKIRETEEPKSLKDVRLMGMDYDFRKDSFSMSYYVGADWIDAKKQQAMVVLPKIASVDFQTMLMECFSCEKACENLDQVFYIRTEDKPIEIDSTTFHIEPLLIVYFLNLVKRIVDKGLKSGYIVREERLNSKIKGKVLMSQYMKHGIATDRKEQVDCRFHEYSINCVENRIIKCALTYCKQMIARSQKALGTHLTQLHNIYSSAMAAFENISSEVSPQELQHIHLNPVFKEYREALPLAKMIIKKRGYCVGQEQASGVEKFPPFIIDMPILFERYVYQLLDKAYKKNILYQTGTRIDRPDFLKTDEKVIIDTKYIPDWIDSINTDNIRQLSGYARSKGIRSKLGIFDNDTICNCLILYPSQEGIDFFESRDVIENIGVEEIPNYIKFWKCGIKLPQT